MVLGWSSGGPWVVLGWSLSYPRVVLGGRWSFLDKFRDGSEVVITDGDSSALQYLMAMISLHVKRTIALELEQLSLVSDLLVDKVDLALAQPDDDLRLGLLLFLRLRACDLDGAFGHLLLLHRIDLRRL